MAFYYVSLPSTHLQTTPLSIHFPFPILSSYLWVNLNICAWEANSVDKPKVHVFCGIV